MRLLLFYPLNQSIAANCKSEKDVKKIPKTEQEWQKYYQVFVIRMNCASIHGIIRTYPEFTDDCFFGKLFL